MSKKDPAKAKQSFEESLEELESIVTSMESDQLPLEKLIANYERGADLLSQCESTLDSAKNKLETIANKASASSKPNSTPSSSDDDEIRLF